MPCSRPLWLCQPPPPPQPPPLLFLTCRQLPPQGRSSLVTHQAVLKDAPWNVPPSGQLQKQPVVRQHFPDFFRPPSRLRFFKEKPAWADGFKPLRDLHLGKCITASLLSDSSFVELSGRLWGAFFPNFVGLPSFFFPRFFTDPAKPPSGGPNLLRTSQRRTSRNHVPGQTRARRHESWETGPVSKDPQPPYSSTFRLLPRAPGQPGIPS